MQISLNWVKELVNIQTISLDDLIEKLTLGGFEVEETLEVSIDNQKQIVLEISATANRSDSLSIYGISKEIAALLNKPIEISKYSLENKKFQTWEQNLENKVEFFPMDSHCPMFLTVLIENLQTLSIPRWITQKLVSSSILPSNNLLDFQNYVLLETGYPFEFYDYGTICSTLKTSTFSLSIEQAKNHQKFVATNDCSYELDPSILTINANEIPISIAGLIQGKQFKVSKNTTKVFIEGSIFNAAKIRQQSRNLGLRTDRSARYEKSLPTTYLTESLYRLIYLLRLSNPDLACKLDRIQQIPDRSPKRIQLRYETVNEILGPILPTNPKKLVYIRPKMIHDYFNRLMFDFAYEESKQTWLVEIPHSRVEDITREIDLIEEIGRLHGFNNFVTALPKLKTFGTEDSHYKLRKKISACLLNFGLNEMIHYSLVKKNTFLSNDVELLNPLLSDCSALRSTLLPNLLKTVQKNLKQKNIPMEGFEYGHIFSFDPINQFKEKEYVSGIFGGIQTKMAWTESDQTLPWFEAKGKIEQFLEQLNIPTDWQKFAQIQTKKLFHPYRSSEIYLKNRLLLGVFGQIDPMLANELNISSEIYFFEFDMETIHFQLQANKLTFYKPYSIYPKITKNLSFIIDRTIRFDTIHHLLYSNGTKFLSTINIIDEYRGESIPKNCTSLCLELVFQSDQKTLETKTIETILKNLQFLLTQKLNATIRD